MFYLIAPKCKSSDTERNTVLFKGRRRQWHPTPVFLPGESQGQRSLVGCHLWGRTESDTTEVINSSSSIQEFHTICNFRHPLGLLECTVSPAEKREGSTILGLNRSEKGKSLKEHSSFWIIWIQRKRIQTDFEGKVIEGNIEGTLTLIAFTGFIQNGIMKMKASKEFFIFFTHLRITAAKADNSRIFIHIK